LLLTDYSYVALLLVCAVLFVAVVIGLPIVLRRFRIVPHNPGGLKATTYECGMVTWGETWVQFNFRYYFYALIFLTLDIMVVFLYPWAVQLKELGTSALLSILVVLLVVAIGYIYAWKSKAFEWE